MIPFRESVIARNTAQGTIDAFARFVGDNDPEKITYRELSRRSGVPPTTLRQLAKGSAITVAQLFALREHLPAPAINLITAAGGNVRMIDVTRVSSNWFKVFSLLGRFGGEVAEALEDGDVNHVEHARLTKSKEVLQAALDGAVAEG